MNTNYLTTPVSSKGLYYKKLNSVGRNYIRGCMPELRYMSKDCDIILSSIKVKPILSPLVQDAIIITVKKNLSLFKKFNATAMHVIESNNMFYRDQQVGSGRDGFLKKVKELKDKM